MEPIPKNGCRHNFKMKYRGTSGRFLTRKQYEKRKYFSELKKNYSAKDSSNNDKNTLPINVLAQELWCRKCNVVGSVNQMSDSDQIDFDQMCRCCLLNIGDITPLYDLHSTEMGVAEVFTFTTSLEFSGDQDPLPTKICNDCYRELNQSYKFVLKCRESNKKLRNHLDEMIKTKDINKRVITKPSKKSRRSFKETSDVRDVKLEIAEFDKQFSQSNNSESISDEHTDERVNITETQYNLIELDILKHEIDLDIKSENEYINNNDEINNALSVSEIQLVDIPELNYIKNEPESQETTSSDSEEIEVVQSVDIESIRVYDNVEINQTVVKECESTETTENQDYQCKLCPKGFKSCSLLRRHHILLHKIKKDGEELVKKPFPCAVCGMLFERKLLLMEHSRIHKGKSRYTCTVCEKPFKQKLTLVRHMNSHSDKKRYSCTVCDESFKYKFSLTCHEETHRKEIIFV